MSSKEPSKGNKQIERDAVATMNTEQKPKPVQLNEQREAKRPSVAVARMRSLEKEQMGKPKKKGFTVKAGKDGKLIIISSHPELDQAKTDVEISMFKAGVYKEAQRRRELLESELYDTVDEDRKAVLERAIWLQGWLTREVLQEINATPHHWERDYIMDLEDGQQMIQKHRDKDHAIKMAEVARKKQKTIFCPLRNWNEVELNGEAISLGNRERAKDFLRLLWKKDAKRRTKAISVHKQFPKPSSLFCPGGQFADTRWIKNKSGLLIHRVYLEAVACVKSPRGTGPRRYYLRAFCDSDKT